MRGHAHVQTRDSTCHMHAENVPFSSAGLLSVYEISYIENELSHWFFRAIMPYHCAFPVDYKQCFLGNKRMAFCIFGLSPISNHAAKCLVSLIYSIYSLFTSSSKLCGAETTLLYEINDYLFIETEGKTLP